MSLLLKVMKGSEKRSTERKAKRCQREALRKREDPTLYQVKLKLKKHPDPSYSTMNEEELTREATHLIDPDSLKEFFSDITHEPIKKILKEVTTACEQQDANTDRLLDSHQTSEHPDPAEIQKRRIDKVGQLTLKLHLRHLDETPSVLARLGAALLKIPYGVLHACLEIGDTENPEVTYIVEFNSSNLVQPRRKKRIECSALEATIPFGGLNLRMVKRTAMTLPTPQHSQGSRARKGDSGQSMAHDLSYICQAVVTPPRERRKGKVSCEANGEADSVTHSGLPSMPRQRSMCLGSSRMTPPARKKVPCCSPDNPNRSNPVAPAAACQQDLESVKAILRESTPKQETTPSVNKTTEAESHPSLHNAAALSPLLQEFRNSVAQYSETSGEELTEYVQLSLSKMLLIDKLVNIIVQYNKRYYYHSITRNCQTFVVDVLQSFGVWENFKFGDKLEQYLENLNKGRKEVYKSHKSINDRVKYLMVSGEINEISYDEARYLRSLYTIFHLEEASKMTTASPVVCSDHECLLTELEKRINEIRPEGAMTLKSPEHYM